MKGAGGQSRLHGPRVPYTIASAEGVLRSLVRAPDFWLPVRVNLLDGLQSTILASVSQVY